MHGSRGANPATHMLTNKIDMGLTLSQNNLLSRRPLPLTSRNNYRQLRGNLKSRKRFCGFADLGKIQKVDPGILIKGAFGEDVRDHLFRRATSHLNTGVFLDSFKKPIKINSMSSAAMLQLRGSPFNSLVNYGLIAVSYTHLTLPTKA